MFFIFIFFAGLSLASFTYANANSSLHFYNDLAQKKIFFNAKGIQTITKIIFHEEINDKRISAQFCFAEGLTRFCKEKGVQEGDLIATHTCEGNKKNYSRVSTLHLRHSFFPQEAHFADIILKAKGYDSIIKRDVITTPAMKKFVIDMIEKGKSSNQNS